MSTPLPEIDLDVMVRGELPAVHPDFGPFGDEADLRAAIEMIGPLPELKDWKPGPAHRGPFIGGMTWCKPVMRTYLWSLAQGLNKAILDESHAGAWDPKSRIGGWKAHSLRCQAVASATTELLGALHHLQDWEKTSLATGADIDIDGRCGEGARLDLLVHLLRRVGSVAKSMQTESGEEHRGNPYTFMYGPAPLRLACDLLRLWNLHPDCRKARDSRTTDAPYFLMVEAVANFARPLAQRIPTTEAARKAIQMAKTAAPQPYPLMAASAPFGWDWDQAYGNRKHRVKVT